MNVGILTYHRSINYGAVIQAYALSQRLKEIPGINVEIIDYMSLKMDLYYKLFTIYRGKNGLMHFPERLTMYRAFKKSMQQLPLSKERLVCDDINKFNRCYEKNYDVIVVGSDAVWNYEKRGFPNPYFLMENICKHKVSYAASCNGIVYNEIDNKKILLLKKSFSDFEYIGVRDELTERVVTRALGENISKHNCDPTFLLDFEKDKLGEDLIKKLEYKLEKKYNWDRNKIHIGLMLSNYNGSFVKSLIQKIRDRYGDKCQIVSVYSYCREADIPYIADLNPFEWSRIFSLFDCTFSKYFHGTLLSILNGTPVISLSAEKDNGDIPTKVEDVLGRLNLKDFLWHSRNFNNINWEVFMKTVDDLINNPPKEKMKNAVENEKRSSKSFFTYINKLKTVYEKN